MATRWGLAPANDLTKVEKIAVNATGVADAAMWPSGDHQPTLSPGYGMMRSSVGLLAAHTCHCRSLLGQVQSDELNAMEGAEDVDEEEEEEEGIGGGGI